MIAELIITRNRLISGQQSNYTSIFYWEETYGNDCDKLTITALMNELLKNKPNSENTSTSIDLKLCQDYKPQPLKPDVTVVCGCFGKN